MQLPIWLPAPSHAGVPAILLNRIAGDERAVAPIAAQAPLAFSHPKDARGKDHPGDLLMISPFCTRQWTD